MAAANAQVVPGLDSAELPLLSMEKLAAMHFGEGCLIEEYLLLKSRN
ncbi:hypothetical protein IH980_04050 [Patescibacteria group bacterium]|nr:hypothetical protein [Patescibacteria group bacterium]